MSKGWTYVIQVEGRVGERWADWFDDLRVTAEGDAQRATTTLTGPVADQAALLGILQKLYTLGLPLLLVQRT
jgi:nucleoid-associated protein YejK